MDSEERLARQSEDAGCAENGVVHLFGPVALVVAAAVLCPGCYAPAARALARTQLEKWLGVTTVGRLLCGLTAGRTHGRSSGVLVKLKLGLESLQTSWQALHCPTYWLPGAQAWTSSSGLEV